MKTTGVRPEALARSTCSWPTDVIWVFGVAVGLMSDPFCRWSSRIAACRLRGLTAMEEQTSNEREDVGISNVGDPDRRHLVKSPRSEAIGGSGCCRDSRNAAADSAPTPLVGSFRLQLRLPQAGTPPPFPG